MKLGRKKRQKRTKLAIEEDIRGEFCYNCSKCKDLGAQGRPMLKCILFGKELAPAFNDSKAERCSDCHLAERFAKGASIYI